MQYIYSILSNLKNNEKNDFLKPNKFDFLSSQHFFLSSFYEDQVDIYIAYCFPNFNKCTKISCTIFNSDFNRFLAILMCVYIQIY